MRHFNLMIFESWNSLICLPLKEIFILHFSPFQFFHLSSFVNAYFKASISWNISSQFHCFRGRPTNVGPIKFNSKEIINKLFKFLLDYLDSKIFQELSGQNADLDLELRLSDSIARRAERLKLAELACKTEY